MIRKTKNISRPHVSPLVHKAKRLLKKPCLEQSHGWNRRGMEGKEHCPDTSYLFNSFSFSLWTRYGAEFWQGGLVAPDWYFIRYLAQIPSLSFRELQQTLQIDCSPSPKGLQPCFLQSYVSGLWNKPRDALLFFTHDSLGAGELDNSQRAPLRYLVRIYPPNPIIRQHRHHVEFVTAYILPILPD